MKIIDELAKKADIVQSSDDVEKARKFAELIVQQAIAVIQRRDMGDNNREDMEVRRCVEDLKKYFEMDAHTNRGWTYPHERETMAKQVLDLFLDQNVTISKSGSEVKIACESGEHARQVFEWLTKIGVDNRE